MFDDVYGGGTASCCSVHAVDDKGLDARVTPVTRRDAITCACRQRAGAPLVRASLSRACFAHSSSRRVGTVCSPALPSHRRSEPSTCLPQRQVLSNCQSAQRSVSASSCSSLRSECATRLAQGSPAALPAADQQRFMETPPPCPHESSGWR